MNELRQGTNFNFSADSMARVGLYSANTLNINPVLRVSEQSLKQLYAIERAIRETNKDPHRP